MFEFNINLTDDDYLQFNEYHLLNSRSGKRSIWFLRVAVIVGFLEFAHYSWTKWKDVFSHSHLIVLGFLWGIFGVFLLIHSKKMLLKSVKKRILKIKKEGKLPYSKQSIIRFDDEVMFETTPNFENKIKYSMIEKIAVTERAIYIYTSSVQAYIFPATLFEDEVQKTEFLQFIHMKAEHLQLTQ